MVALFVTHESWDIEHTRILLRENLRLSLIADQLTHASTETVVRSRTALPDDKVSTVQSTAFSIDSNAVEKFALHSHEDLCVYPPQHRSDRTKERCYTYQESSIHFISPRREYKRTATAETLDLNWKLRRHSFDGRGYLDEDMIRVSGVDMRVTILA